MSRSSAAFPEEADLIDIQIAEIFESSLGVGNYIDVQVPPGQMSLLPEQLAEDAMDRFLEDMEMESRGVRRNKTARRFLSSLPPGLTHQEYKLLVNGDERRKVELGENKHPRSAGQVTVFDGSGRCRYRRGL